MYNICCYTDIDHRLENTLQQKIKQIKKMRRGILKVQYIFPPPYQTLPAFTGVISWLWTADFRGRAENEKSTVCETNESHAISEKQILKCSVFSATG